MSLNDITIDKNDELKYLILMKENFRKYKLKTNYFFRWKKSASFNENSINIKDNDSFDNNNIRLNYGLFKSMNSLSCYPKLRKININIRSNSLYRYNSLNNIENESFDKKKSKIINIWEKNLKACKNNNFCFIRNSNKNKDKSFKIDKFNINIKGFLNNKPSINNDKNKEMDISNFEIKYFHNNQLDNLKSLFIDKFNKYNNIRIIKNKQFSIINNYEGKNKRFEIISNSLDIKQVERNKNNKQILRNKNNNINDMQDIYDKKYTSKHENIYNEETQFMGNILIIVIVILMLSLIINELNIDNF